MCGIGGVYNYRNNNRILEFQLRWMAYAMRHRGPDGEGFHIDGDLGLAHRRLAIIDIEHGAQPMSTADKKLWISYNGEVYNYVELLDELRSLGHEPQTRSDTEAVLLAYRQWGLNFPKHLNGMFAIAIWDAGERKLILCRDRLGIKPLYYAHVTGGISFASELKSLRTTLGFDSEMDLEALDEYMTCGYVTTPNSLARGGLKLPPGTLMVVEPDRDPIIHKYWEVAFEPDFGPSAAEWEAEIRETFIDAVRLRLRSDVPLGALLSGGVDSTLIATTMKRLVGSGTEIDTFCVGVDLPGAINEFQESKAVADEAGLAHHELRMTADEYGAALIEAATLLDEPLVEPMIGQLLSVSRLAKKHVSVVLSGEGADETWFGYKGYRVQYGVELLQKLIPGNMREHLQPGLEKLASRHSIPAKAAKYLRLLSEPLERRYLGLNYFDTALKDSLYKVDVRDQLAGHDAREVMRHLYDSAGGPECLSRMAAVDCRAWLVDNTLLRSDHMSMAASLELRVPFLDHRLVELAMRVPAKFKVSPHDQKVVLKNAFRDRLPAAVAKRRKLGFPTPVAQLFRGEWGKRAGDVLSEPPELTKHLFDRSLIRKKLAEHRTGDKDWSPVLFQVLMLEYWAREFGRPPVSMR